MQVMNDAMGENNNELRYIRSEVGGTTSNTQIARRSSTCWNYSSCIQTEVSSNSWYVTVQVDNWY